MSAAHPGGRDPGGDPGRVTAPGGATGSGSARGSSASGDSQPPEEELYPFWRRNMGVMAAATFCLTVGFGATNPFLPLAMKELGATGPLEVWVGYAMGAYFGLSFFLMPLWGVVADHYGRKLMALRTSLGMACIYLLLPFSPNVWWFIALFVLMGTTNGFIPATNALIVTNTPPRAMGQALSRVQSGTLIGGAIGPALGAAIASLLPGYRYLFWVGGALLGLAGLLTLLLAEERHTRPSVPFRMHPIADLRVILRLPNIRRLMYLAFIHMFTLLGSATIISVFTLQLLAEEGIHAGPQLNGWVGAVTLSFTLASALSVPFWGRLLDRFGAPRVLAVSLLCGAVGSLPTIAAQTPLQLVLARFALGLLAIGIGPALLAIVKGYAPAGMESRVLAYASAFGALGIGGGPFIAGLIGPVLGLRAFFALNSALLLLGFAVWLRALTRGAAADRPRAPVP